MTTYIVHNKKENTIKVYDSMVATGLDLNTLKYNICTKSRNDFTVDGDYRVVKTDLQTSSKLLTQDVLDTLNELLSASTSNDLASKEGLDLVEQIMSGKIKIK
ncbi:hypothetical protein Phi19:1_gp038 [Cellulophaga phage phi19:1]|uniref:Uncharacterized protein n=1 Tax=Cellulophaga phage phi19:1 TaxID=1327970 RepID=R9ZZE2_9CAUD|nr:hypothetical protein Phi19:1_gp038 [Cellulophaga phage phi19:1]AGO47328.1 hypothetical protein Phi19:1_gp038 [Cellulophaga phage phi19:1]